MLKNFKKENIGPCSYDLRLKEIFKPKKIVIVDLSKDKITKFTKLKLPYILKPGEFLLGKTFEEFDTPLNIMSILKTKSTSFRIGLKILCAVNDPGYKGEIVFGIHNISNNKIKIFKGMSLLQAVFIDLKGSSVPIQTKYMGGNLL